jgi:prefoldin subunit 5
MTNVHERLGELRREAATGRQQLEMLEARRVELRDTLLRIDGAIQVLEEVSAADGGEVADVAETA